jgi:hypothetical protein
MDKLLTLLDKSKYWCTIREFNRYLDSKHFKYEIFNAYNATALWYLVKYKNRQRLFRVVYDGQYYRVI